MTAREQAAARAVSAVQRCGGIARSAELLRQGVSQRGIADAVTSGALVRVRRRWVAARTADADLIDAARRGGIVTCVSQARRLGLWVRADRQLHIAVHGHSGRAITTDAVVHRDRPVVPRDPAVAADGVENTLMLVARCLPEEDALAVWESALRKRLVEREVLARLPLHRRARELLGQARPYSDSGLETLVPYRLRWLDVPVRAQTWLVGHRVDFLIGDRLVLQIDGAHHVGSQRASDIAHDAQLLLHGYHVIRIGYWDIVEDWPRVQDTIMRAIGQGLHLAR